MLYEWAEEYEPDLFSRIQKLVAEGKWHIMGGWYLQPDCNMPSGEALIRQIRLGRDYFKKKFGVVCSTAVNFDSFGHDRGLVQLLSKCGYDSYLFMRPDKHFFDYPADLFIWTGFDGSSLLCHHIDCGYHSNPGLAVKKIRSWLDSHKEEKQGLIPWGVGNHGGGPSRKDISAVNTLIHNEQERMIFHSWPEQYFESAASLRDQLPKCSVSMNPFAPGTYTSQCRVKQQYRQLENEIDLTEKMLTDVFIRQGNAFPDKELAKAEKDLCLVQFHDILPGTCIQDAEEFALQTLGHGLRICRQLQDRAFFAMIQSEKKPQPGETAVIVYNPLPRRVLYDVSAEFMLEDAEERTGWFSPVVKDENGLILSSQAEKERSNMAWEWRKRVVFRAELKPLQINRFDISVINTKKKPVIGQDLSFDNGIIKASIDPCTGLIMHYSVEGREYLSAPACRLLVMKDSADSWSMIDDRFNEVAGVYRLMTEKESADFADTDKPSLSPVRVIEDGSVRKVIEAFFIFNGSQAVIRYTFSYGGKSVLIEVFIRNSEINRMIKLEFPSAASALCLGQAIFGWQALNSSGKENVSQQWVAAADSGDMLTIINSGSYGSDFTEGRFRISLLRTPGYAAHPMKDLPILPRDRFSPHMDTGMRRFRFALCGGKKEERIENISDEAQLFNEPPYALACFPGGDGQEKLPLVTLTGKGIQLSNIRPDHARSSLSVRLFNTTDRPLETTLSVPLWQRNYAIALKPFEFITFRISREAEGCTVISPV